jgi:hypothetical protein
VGFGRGEILCWIAARLGPTGRAVGIELRQETVDARGPETGEAPGPPAQRLTAENDMATLEAPLDSADQAATLLNNLFE